MDLAFWLCAFAICAFVLWLCDEGKLAFYHFIGFGAGAGLSMAGPGKLIAYLSKKAAAGLERFRNNDLIRRIEGKLFR